MELTGPSTAGKLSSSLQGQGLFLQPYCISTIPGGHVFTACPGSFIRFSPVRLLILSKCHSVPILDLLVNFAGAIPLGYCTLHFIYCAVKRSLRFPAAHRSSDKETCLYGLPARAAGHCHLRLERREAVMRFWFYRD